MDEKKIKLVKEIILKLNELAMDEEDFSIAIDSAYRLAEYYDLDIELVINE